MIHFTYLLTIDTLEKITSESRRMRKKTNIIKSNSALSSPQRTESLVVFIFGFWLTPYALICFIGSSDYLYIDDSQVNFLWPTFLCPKPKFSYILWISLRFGNFNHTPKFKLSELFLLYLPLQLNVIHSPKCVWGPRWGGDAAGL